MLKKIVFDDFVRLGRGFDLPDNKIVEGEYPVVASTNIKAFHCEYKVDPPVVVTGRSGSLGKVQYVTSKCWPLNTALYSKDCRSNVPQYIYYYLQTMHLEQYNAGAGVPTLNQNHLQRLKILVHEPSEQTIVASILAAYDNLIENNNNRIKILEQMAENLYKEWFVRFRFPNYQNTEFENGIPKGWKVIQVQDLFDISIGRTPDRKVFEYFSNNQSDYLWISIADMKDKMFVMSSAEYLTCDAIRKVNMPMVSENTVILSFKLSVGRVAITTQLSCTNEAIAHFNTNNKQLVEYTYLYLKFFQYQDLGNTSAIGNAVNSTIIRKMKFLYPDKRCF